MGNQPDHASGISLDPVDTSHDTGAIANQLCQPPGLFFNQHAQDNTETIVTFPPASLAHAYGNHASEHHHQRDTIPDTICSFHNQAPGQNSEYLQIYDAVRSTDQPNYKHARIPLTHDLNIAAWRHYLQDYEDKELCDLLMFGFPMGYRSPWPPIPTFTNHKSALDYPTHVEKYLTRELKSRAIMGPFPASPFLSGCQISPMMSREKRNDTSRRIIVDMSFPHGASVNDGIPKDVYMGNPVKLTLPTVDDVIDIIKQQGRGCYLYSRDLKNAYRQWRADPLDWPLLCVRWNGDIYVDISISFGIRFGAYICSRITNSICYIHHQDNNTSLVYIDDFLGVAPSHEAATSGFHRLGDIFMELGVKESDHKAISPTTKITWIGVEFDTIDMMIRVPPQKIADTLQLTLQWAHRTYATRHQLQQLLGRLFHIAQCVKPARLFVSRMLETLRNSPAQGHTILDEDFKADIHWWAAFLPMYNGLHLIDPPRTHTHIDVDACLTGCGGLMNETQYYHARFPEPILQQNRPICHLEMLNIVAAIKIWAPQCNYHTITIHCDNSVAISVLATGRGRDSYLLRCAREIWFITALHHIQLIAHHKPATQMKIPDALSRTHLSQTLDHHLSSLSPNNRHHISEKLFTLSYDQ